MLITKKRADEQTCEDEGDAKIEKKKHRFCEQEQQPKTGEVDLVEALLKGEEKQKAEDDQAIEGAEEGDSPENVHVRPGNSLHGRPLKFHGRRRSSFHHGKEMEEGGNGYHPRSRGRSPARRRRTRRGQGRSQDRGSRGVVTETT